MLETLPGDLGKWIRHRGDDSLDSGRDHRLGARGGLAVVAAWLQSDIECGASGQMTGLPERVDLGMRSTIDFVPALADDPAIAHDDGADHRVRFDPSPTPLR